jgi:peptidoglycan/LPS O-acetylase OafA/YrhL
VLLVVIVAVTVAATVDSIRSSIPGLNHFVATLLAIQASPSLVYAAKQGKLWEWAFLFAAFCGGVALFALRRWVLLRWDLALVAVGLWLGTLALGGNAPLTGAAVLAPYVLVVVAYRTYGRVRMPKGMGDYSYGAYLYGFPAQQTIILLLDPGSGWVVLLVALPVVAILAVLSWHFVEAPALAFKARARPGGPAPAATTI